MSTILEIHNTIPCYDKNNKANYSEDHIGIKIE